MAMLGPEILARAMSVPMVASGIYKKRFGIEYKWQYNSRSDQHSKVGCWVVLFDLLRTCELLQQHARTGKIGFGINHTMTDFGKQKDKNLDLVVSRFAPSKGALVGSRGGTAKVSSFDGLAAMYGIPLNAQEQSLLASLPTVPVSGVSSVLVAVEAKAAMTAHQRAIPRLQDELNSSHLTVHGDTDQAIAAGLVMINAAGTFISTDSNEYVDPTVAELNVSKHDQPRDAQLVLKSLDKLQLRSSTGTVGFDALGVLTIDCRNDGITPVTIVKDSPPAPGTGSSFDYDRFINRLGTIYSTRFAAL